MSTVARPTPPSPTPGLSVECLRLSEGIMLVLRGELDLSTASLLEVELTRAAESHRLIVLDLRVLDFIDSTGLHVLIRSHQRVHESGGRLLVVTGSPQVNRVFELTRIAEHLEVVAEPPALAD